MQTSENWQYIAVYIICIFRKIKANTYYLFFSLQWSDFGISLLLRSIFRRKFVLHLKKECLRKQELWGGIVAMWFYCNNIFKNLNTDHIFLSHIIYLREYVGTFRFLAQFQIAMRDLSKFRSSHSLDFKIIPLNRWSWTGYLDNYC